MVRNDPTGTAIFFISVSCFCCKVVTLRKDYGGWYQSTTDDFDWTRCLGPTWPYNTAPSPGDGGLGEFSKTR